MDDLNDYDKLSVDARELILWAENTYKLQGQFLSIIANIKRKIKAGVYSGDKAPLLWFHWINEARKDYKKEFGFWFSKDVCVESSQYLARVYYDAIQNGEY